ncbi:MAG: hypothetical protein R3B36_15680 [Polyangiaceae bacterium]
MHRHTRGAVYVEFLVAFMPVFVCFLCLLQLALLYSQRLLVDHAAVQSARAAAVVFADSADAYGDGASGVHTLSAERRRAVREAALISLAPAILDGSVDRVELFFPDATMPGGPDLGVDAPLTPLAVGPPQMVRVRVEVDVVCKIALADRVACERGSAGRQVRRIRAESAFPYQGARYVYR